MGIMSREGNDSDNTTRNASTSNRTAQPFSINGPNWDFMGGFYVVIIILALFTNGPVLVAFFSRRNLWTPFNVYLMNLLSANILNVVLQNIPDLFNHLYSGWWLGDGYCSVLVFGLYFLNAGVQNCHILIAINRIWAVFWPYSYRHSHTKRVALLFCLAGWLEVSAMVLPGFILDILYYRTDPLKNGCSLNIEAQWMWSAVTQFLLYNMGLQVMWLAYPIIWYKRRLVQKVAPTTAAIETARSETDKRRSSVEQERSARETTVGRSGVPRPRQKRSSKAFTVLTVLTISVTVCWTPIHVLYTLMLWWPFDRIGPLLLDIAVVLFSLQSVLDPILFVCTLPELQESLRRAITRAG
ncbi:hypothetical protein BV898_05587 [Hypsibius exemplaris]|uniref:G-protein coupled receptors family 1 profile domain-containing protein n=1 Tax=Hypsibius exemplaris TaxID=2072580 RepID=A0A1W0WZC3_HYPEX|nr:hypothetical protein BV898_05587 [Hypsibius exemplaris]